MKEKKIKEPKAPKEKKIKEPKTKAPKPDRSMKKTRTEKTKAPKTKTVRSADNSKSRTAGSPRTGKSVQSGRPARTDMRNTAARSRNLKAATPPAAAGAAPQTSSSSSPTSSQSVYGLVALVFGLISVLCFGLWAAFFPIAFAIILGLFGLFEQNKEKWSSITGLSLAGVGMMLCCINLLLQTGPAGTLFRAPKALDSRFFGRGAQSEDYDDYDFDDEDYEEFYDDEFLSDEEDYDEYEIDPEDFAALLNNGGDSEAAGLPADSTQSSLPGNTSQTKPSAKDASGQNPSQTTQKDPGFAIADDGMSIANSDTPTDLDTDPTVTSPSPQTSSGTGGYQDIYNEYAGVLQSMGSDYLSKFNDAAARKDDSVDLVELCTAYQDELEKKSDEGLEKLSDYMDEIDGEYDEYEQWYDMLYDVYMAEYDRLDEALFNIEDDDE